MKKFLAWILICLMAISSLAAPALAESEANTPEPVETEAPQDEQPVETEEAVTELPPEEETAEPTQQPDEPAQTDEVQPTAEPESAVEPTDMVIDDVTEGEYATIAEGDWRVVIGANLSDEQKAQVLAIFGVEQSDENADKFLTVTNDEERQYFSGKLPDEQIGTRSISCIYIKGLKKGKGLDVKTHNIDYCTEDMYINVLNTIGITDAKVIVAAPIPVSGTAALTGVYKAYEDLTGKTLSAYLKNAGIEELITTGQLAEIIGSDEATAIINELKLILDETKDMTDEEVEQKIREIASEYNVSLTDNQVTQIRILSRTFEGLDVEQIRDRIMGLANATTTWGKFTQTITNTIESIGNFFKEVANFFSELFTKWFKKD